MSCGEPDTKQTMRAVDRFGVPLQLSIVSFEIQHLISICFIDAKLFGPKLILTTAPTEKCWLLCMAPGLSASYGF